MLISGKPLICIEEETEAQFTSAPDPERSSFPSEGTFPPTTSLWYQLPHPRLLCETNQAYLSSVELQR